MDVERSQNARETRKERYQKRQNALETALAGLLIAQGYGVRTAEQKAQNAMKQDWRKVRSELRQRWKYDYDAMVFRE